MSLLRSDHGRTSWAKLWEMALLADSSLYDSGFTREVPAESPVVPGRTTLKSTSLPKPKVTAFCSLWYGCPPIRGLVYSRRLESSSGAKVKVAEGVIVWRAAVMRPNHGPSAACASPKRRVSALRLAFHAAK